MKYAMLSEVIQVVQSKHTVGLF